MGTRNITQVIVGGKTVVSQYCQWDGYPEGQGAVALEFLKKMNRTIFELKLGKVTHPTQEENNKMWEEALITVRNEQGAHEDKIKEDVKRLNDTGMIGMDVSEEFTKNHPTLQRDMGADVLQYIHDSTKPVALNIDLDFVKDSLFCEYAYVIDLDNNKFEVYEGFNKDPVPADNRFQLDGDEARETADGSEHYHPVVLAKTYDLDDLPTEEQFIKDFAEEEVDHEAVAKDALDELRNTLIVDSDHVEVLTKMVNYLDANLDDFLEATDKD